VPFETVAYIRTDATPEVPQAEFLSASRDFECVSSGEQPPEEGLFCGIVRVSTDYRGERELREIDEPR